MADRIVYKNHCTPQEKLGFAAGDRWYLDSDCGRKLSGNCVSKSTSIGTPVTKTYAGEYWEDFSNNWNAEENEWAGVINLSSVKFIHIKNTDTSGSDHLLLNIGSMGAVIKLEYGESFASDVDNTTVAITASGTTSFEYVKGA